MTTGSVIEFKFVNNKFHIICSPIKLTKSELNVNEIDVLYNQNDINKICPIR